MTALQPPPPSPAHSVNPDNSAFGTATLHARNRTTDPPTGEAQTRPTAFCLVPTDKKCFVAGDPNHVASAATVASECTATTTATNTPCPTSSSRPTRAGLLAVPLQPHNTLISQPRQCGLGLLPQWLRCPAHDHASHSVLNRLCFSHNPTVQTGRHPRELRLR